MKHRIATYLVAVVLLVGVGSCGKKGSGPVPAPGAFLLTLPANNSACLKGASESETSAEVEFTWNGSANAASYVLEVKDLKAQKATTYTTKESTFKVMLEANKPYSWSVKAVNATGEKESEVWFFYLTGKIADSYAPFPAVLKTPKAGASISSNGAETVAVTFTWEAADPDNDVAGYTLYLDSNDATTAVGGTLAEATASQMLERGKTYYWKVVATDSAGNTSISEVGVFRIV